jgi:hypothetical protein
MLVTSACSAVWLPKGGLDQVHQFDPEMEHVHRLRRDQAQVQRQLQPAAGKDQVGQGPQGALGRVLDWQWIMGLGHGKGYGAMHCRLATCCAGASVCKPEPSVACKCHARQYRQVPSTKSRRQHHDECHRVRAGREPRVPPSEATVKAPAFPAWRPTRRCALRPSRRLRRLLGPPGAREPGVDQALHPHAGRVQCAVLQVV